MSAESLLVSWRDTATRQAIVDLVRSVSSAGANYVSPADRVAVFDNDGTLWSEKPIPIQLDFTLYRLAEQAGSDSTLAGREPYRAALERDYRWPGKAMVKHYHGDESDLDLLLRAVESAFVGMSVRGFAEEASQWLRSAVHPVLERPYLSCAFVPMVELLRYLEANGFATYIASGGDRDFMRPFAEELYQIPPERVIGSALGLDFRMDDDGTDLLYKSKVEFFDDGPEKPIRIWSRIGRRPLVAGGNSNGDVPMLRFAHTSERPGLRLLVLHDDPEREFDCTSGAEDALARARDRAWTVISIADDWSTVFGDEVHR